MAAQWRKGNCSLAWQKKDTKCDCVRERIVCCAVRACVREREKGGRCVCDKGLICLSERDNDACFVCACGCLCVCVRERERDNEAVRACVYERERGSKVVENLRVLKKVETNKMHFLAKALNLPQRLKL